MDLDSRQQWIPRSALEHGRSHFCLFVPKFLSQIRDDLVRVRNANADQITYEQLGAVCINLDSYWSMPNPAIAPYWQQLLAQFGPALSSLTGDSPEDAFADLVDHAINWIRRVVELELLSASSLIKPMDSPLGRLLEFCLKNSPSWSVVTLNHDLMIEACLLQLGLNHHDGFGDREGIVEFDPAILRKSPSHTLLKLHGSINWHWLPDRQNYMRRHIGDGETAAWRARPESEILFGDYTKLQDYNYGPYPYLFAAFDRILEQTDRLIICGYGFQDKGINIRLLNELHYRSDFSALIIHPAPRDLLLLMPFHAKRALKPLLCVGKVRLIRGMLHDVLESEPNRNRLRQYIKSCS